MSYRVGSLFAGVGGICLGFKRASDLFKLSFANEMDDAACRTYSANFNHNLIKGDIEKILDPDILIRERNFLLRRSEELSREQFNNLNYNDKIIKDSIKNLNNPFFVSILMKGNFDLTDSIKKKILKFGYNENEFKNFLEYKLVLLNLENYTEEKLSKVYNDFSLKNQQITEERIDILTAGFPCQAFSIAGERKGFSDHRGELFYSVVNLVNQLKEKGHGKPRVLFLENVKNLISHDDGNTFKVIKAELEDLGYTLKYKVLNTYKYTTLPQNRERIFVICFLNKKDADAFGSFEDIPELNRTKAELRNSLSKILDYSITKETNPEFYYTREKYPQYFMTKEEYLESGKNECINLNNDIDEMYEIYQVRRGMYVRKNQSGVCPTLTANMGTGGHNVPLIKTNDGIRKLSPKDCFNLQGFRVGEEYTFPDKISSAALYKQSGNAVSVDVIELIARKILQAFLEVDGDNFLENNLNIAEKRNNSDNRFSDSIEIENLVSKAYLINRFKYFKTKKYGYFKKRILRHYKTNPRDLKNSYKLENSTNIVTEKNELCEVLIEIKNNLNNNLNYNLTQKELEKLRKEIMIKLSKTL